MMFEFLAGKRKKVRRLLEEGRFTELQGLNYKITSYLKDFLREHDYSLVKNAIIFSAMIKDDETVSELISLTHCEDQRLQRLSSIALAQIGTEKAVKSLIDNLMSDNPVFRKYAEEAIINYLNKDAIYYISRALISSDTYVKLVCLKALASLGRDTYLHENIINPIIQLLKDKSSKIRSEAAYTLGTIKYEAAIDKLISLLDDPMPSVREAAIDAISRFSTEKAFLALLRGIKNSHDYVKIVSAEKIGDFGDDRATELLGHCLRDRNIFLRKTAVNSLFKIGSRTALSYLKIATKDTDQEIKKQALKYVEMLKRQLDDTDTISENNMKKFVSIDASHGQNQSVIFRLSEIEHYIPKDFKLNKIYDFSPAEVDKSKILFIPPPVLKYSKPEIEYLHNFVYNGGKLILLGSWGRDFGNDILNTILDRFEIVFNNDLLCDYCKTAKGYRITFVSEIVIQKTHPLFYGVDKIEVFKSCSITPGKGTPIAYGSKYSFADENMNLKPDKNEKRGYIPVIVFLKYGRGIFLCIGDYRIFTEGLALHKTFLKNIIEL